jgi:hypothetical protein
LAALVTSLIRHCGREAEPTSKRNGLETPGAVVWPNRYGPTLASLLGLDLPDHWVQSTAELISHTFPEWDLVATERWRAPMNRCVLERLGQVTVLIGVTAAAVAGLDLPRASSPPYPPAATATAAKGTASITIFRLFAAPIRAGTIPPRSSVTGRFSSLAAGALEYPP